MLTFRQEAYSDAVDEAQPLLVDHWHEIALNKDTVPLEPDWERYRQLERAGVLNLTTARDDGELVGYALYIVAANLHYRGLVVADSDVFFLDRRYRRGSAGLRLLQAAEDNLVAAGVGRIVNRVKIHHDVGPIFLRLGFTPIERVYSKLVR